MSGLRQDDLKARLELLFHEELQDNLQILTAGLARVSSGGDGAGSGELLAELFRAAHSLKGAAHSAGVLAAVEPCRRLESLLAELRDRLRALDDDAIALFADALDELGAVDRELRHRSTSPRPPQPQATDAPSSRPSTTTDLPQSRARIGVAELDDLIDRTGALVSATARLHLLSDTLADRRDGVGAPDQIERIADQAGAVDRELSHAARSVTEAAHRLRMQRIDDVTAGLEHTVQELARSMGKQASLSVHGGELKVDRDIGDALRDPLLHLVRNAVDHGLETVEQRTSTGKPPVGAVRIEAVLEGGRVRIAVADDGRGVDLAALRAAAGDATDAPGAAPGLELAFRPGVSTAGAVTDVSGRGVGLDAVRARVESLGGTVHLWSSGSGGAGARGAGPAVGTEVVMHVPMTLAVVRVVLVAVGDELIGIPAGTVARARRVEPEMLQSMEGRLLLVEDDGARAAVPLAAALGLAGGGPARTVIELVDEEGVLLVDGVDVDVEGVLRRLPPRSTASASVLGALVLPGDRVALVVNPAACLRAAVHQSGVDQEAGDAAVPDRAVILLAEDTLTTRALERSILVGAGYEVVDVADGADAWDVLSRQRVDLVVSDVDMPRMGGIELCRAIRSSTQRSDLPVVLVTSMASEDDRRRGLEAGANAYLVKSAFDQATLLDAVRRLL